MSELTHQQFGKSVNRVRYYLNKSIHERGRAGRRCLAYAIYAAMGHDPDSASYQKVYAFMRKAGLRWIPSKGEWVYISFWKFWMSIEPLYRPHWTATGTVNMFMDLLYMDQIPVDLERWMSS